MIYTDEVQILWDKRNYKHYVDLGYEFSGWSQKFTVKVEHLTRGSNVKIKVICDYCGDVAEKFYYNYTRSKENELVTKDCCLKCRKHKTKETNLIKYGVDHQIKREDVLNKTKKTNQEKYGVDFPLQNSEIFAKTKQTKIAKYGTDNVLLLPEVRRKIEDTNQSIYGVKYPLENEVIYAETRKKFKENYGAENLWENEELKEKARQTFLLRYGGPSPFSSSQIRKKAIRTFNQRYGVNSVGEIPGIQEKIDLIMIKKYGSSSPIQNPNLKKKINETNVRKYGVDFPLQSIEIREKATKTMTENGRIPTSFQQKYLHHLLGGELNYQQFEYNLDIAFVNLFNDFNVFIEYDGSGHDFKVKLGKQSNEEFMKREKVRFSRLNGKNRREIRFISRKDLTDKI
jgi:hypothetical protein